MVDIAKNVQGPSDRREAILEAIAYAAEKLLASDDWTAVQLDVLKSLGTAAGVSRAYISLNAVDESGRIVSGPAGEWCAPGVSPVSGDRSPTATGSWSEGWIQRLKRGDVISGAAKDFPAEERAKLRNRGAMSILCVPVFVRGGWRGVIGFDDRKAQRRWAAEEIDALRIAAGVLGAAIARNESDADMRESEHRYRALAERSPDAVLVRLGDSIAYANPAAARLLGAEDPSELVGIPALSIVHPDFHETILERFEAQAKGEEAPVLRETLVRLDGSSVEAEVSAVPITFGGEPAGLVTIRDISAEIEAQEQLRQAESRTRRLIEQVPGVIYTDVRGKDGIVRMGFVSPQIEEITGYAPDRFIEDPDMWWRIVHPGDVDRVGAIAERRTASAELFDEEYRMVAADGRVLWVHDVSSPVLGPDGELEYQLGFLEEITARKDAEARLLEAEERYRVLAEQLPAVTYIESLEPGTSVAAGVTYISPRVEELLGYPPSRWRETFDFYLEIVHPEDREMAARVAEEAGRTGQPLRMDYRMIAADGRTVWVREEAELVRDPDGSPKYWQGFLLDISERKRAEEQLAQAEAHFRLMVERLPAIAYTEVDQGAEFYDPKSSVAYVSPQIEPILGYSVDDWSMPGFWAKVMYPDDLQAVVAESSRLSRDKVPTYSQDYRMVAKDGTVRWFHDESRLISDSSGRPLIWQGLMIDITERKRVEEQLRLAEERYRTLVEQNPAAMYTQEIDPQTGVSRTTYLSPSAEEIDGYGMDDVAADPDLWLKIIHPDDRERVLEEDRATNAGATDWSCEYRVITRDGRVVWVRDQAKLLQVGDQPPFWQGFILDITEQKRAEEQLERALEVERDAASRLRALDEMKNTFLQAVSHDLRTPLAAILGLAVTLERGDVELDIHDTRDMARRIADNARRLDRLVTNLLDLDRLARGIVAPKLHPTDLGALVRRVLAESELLSGSRLHTDLQPAVVDVDASKVERIVENLLANTARHTPSTAQIWVSVQPTEDGALLLVEDDGPGVPTELRTVIFEPFQQGADAPQHSPGVGVGLTLVARFAELHGGRAWVEERTGGGASFRVLLPKHGAPAI